MDILGIEGVYHNNHEMCFKFQTCFDTMYLTSINILVTSNIFFELYIRYFNG